MKRYERKFPLSLIFQKGKRNEKIRKENGREREVKGKRKERKCVKERKRKEREKGNKKKARETRHLENVIYQNRNSTCLRPNDILSSSWNCLYN
jgi:hypothetical protein